MYIIDRRLNPKSKSLGNRQRFMRRAKAEIREAVREAMKKRSLSDLDRGERIKIRSKRLDEPAFTLGRQAGARDYVLPGNKGYQVGDLIPKPREGAGRGGQQGSPDGEGNDDFVFTLTREEYLDLFFEDLKLPNLVKAKLKDMKAPMPVRAGFQVSGSPARLNRLRSMRNSLGRRIALRRPSLLEIARLEREIERAERDGLGAADVRLVELRARLARLLHMRRVVPYLDPVDLKYNRFERTPKPAVQAVMFCLMDVSASMTEPLKDLAKRFFMLLYVFLSRHYKGLDIVFIRHTSEAAEVDEEAFFRGTETGGTVVSSVLEEMLRIIEERYPVAEWNIYAAQASDGHNVPEDMELCNQLLQERLIPACQYFAYIEVGAPSIIQPGESMLWSGYEQLLARCPAFAMRRVFAPDEIYPVFHDLFSGSAGRKEMSR